MSIMLVSDFIGNDYHLQQGFQQQSVRSYFFPILLTLHESDEPSQAF